MDEVEMKEENGARGGVVNQTLVDQVAGSLRVIILNGQISPGERLKIKDLTHRFGVSHIPIREALLRLESEGLVVRQAHRGVTVTGLTLGELQEVYDARKLLEPMIGKRAVERAQEADLRRVAAALQDMEQAAARSDLNAYMDVHRTFHWLTLKPGATRLLEQVLRQLWQTSERYVRFVLTVGRALELAQTQHKQMYRFYSARDSVRFADQVLLHLDSTQEVIRSAMDTLGSADEPGARAEAPGFTDRDEAGEGNPS